HVTGRRYFSAPSAPRGIRTYRALLHQAVSRTSIGRVLWPESGKDRSPGRDESEAAEDYWRRLRCLLPPDWRSPAPSARCFWCGAPAQDRETPERNAPPEPRWPPSYLAWTRSVRDNRPTRYACPRARGLDRTGSAAPAAQKVFSCEIGRAH